MVDQRKRVLRMAATLRQFGQRLRHDRQEAAAFLAATSLTAILLVLGVFYLVFSASHWLDNERSAAIVVASEAGFKVRTSLDLLRGVRDALQPSPALARLTLPANVASAPLDARWQAMSPALVAGVQLGQRSSDGFIQLTQVVARSPDFFLSVAANANQPVILQVPGSPSDLRSRLYDNLQTEYEKGIPSRIGSNLRWTFATQPSPPIVRNILRWEVAANGAHAYAANEVDIRSLLERVGSGQGTGDYFIVLGPSTIIASRSARHPAIAPDLPVIEDIESLERSFPRYPGFSGTVIALKIVGTDLRLLVVLTWKHLLLGLWLDLAETLLAWLLIIGSVWWLYAFAVQRWLRPKSRAESALRDASRELETVVAVCPVGIALVDRRRGDVLRINEAARGICPDLHVGLSLPEALLRLGWHGVEHLAQAIDHLRDNQAKTVSLARDTEDHQAVDVLVYGLSVESGPLALCAFVDLTKERQLRAQAETSQAQAEHANESLKAFVATIAHEIRTPLSAIIGAADLLRRGSDRVVGRDLPRTIASSADVLLRTVNDILDFSKLEAGRMEVHAFDARLAEVFERLEFLYGERARNQGLALSFYIGRDVDTVLHTDWVRLQQVLGNLIDNALKFTRHGHISVVARPGDTDGLWIEVTDTGAGLDAKLKARIGTPFLQARGANAAGGTGLGLTVCQRLCRLLGGALTVRSELGLGSSFRVELPLHLPPTKPIAVRDDLVLHVMACPPEFEFVALDMCERAGLRAVVRPLHRHLGSQPQWRVDVLLRRDASGPRFSLRLSCDPADDKVPTTWIDLGDSEAMSRALNSPRPSTPEPSSGPRCLLVEDDEIGREVISERLERLGIRVDCAATIAEADRYLARAPETLRLVITDFNLPDGLGSQVAALARESCPGLPVVCLSAGISPMHGDQARQAGFTEMLGKPVSEDELRRLVRAAAPEASEDQQGPSLRNPLLGKFLHQTVTDLRMARRLLRRGSSQAAARYVHRITGAAAMMGMSDVLARAQLWERLLSAGQMQAQGGARLLELRSLVDDDLWRAWRKQR